MNEVDGLEGAARFVLVDGVSYLDPATAVFEAMLDGWQRQQRVRFLKASTIKGRVELVQRLATFSGQYPWEWTVGEVEAFFDHLRSESRGTRPIALSTARNYECDLKLFLEFVTDSRYGWPGVCVEKFGSAPQMLLHERNSLRHVTDYEGRPGRRPLSYDEVQQLFDAADGRVEQARERGRKGGLAAQRDALVLKVIYAFGLRRREAWGLDLQDLRSAPKAPQFGRCGGIFVRHGKSSRGSAPKRRQVLLVPEMDWIVEPLEQWLDEVRALFSPGRHPALFVTERRGRLSRRSINEAFETARVAAGIDPELDLHCLRHSYVTHLVEFGYPGRFVQEQAGHAYASTTAIYTGVSDEYRSALLAKALQATAPDMWG